MTSVLTVGDLRVQDQDVRKLTEAAPDISSVEAVTSTSVLPSSVAEVHSPVVAIIGGDRPPDEIAFAARSVQRQATSGGVLLATASSTTGSLQRALRDGVKGCVLTDSPGEELITAVRAVAAGRLFLPARCLPGLADTLLMLEFQGHRTGSGDELTSRELDVFRLLALGHPNSDIANALFISDATVHSHVLNILRKLRVRNRTEAVVVFYRRGLSPALPPAEPAGLP